MYKIYKFSGVVYYFNEKVFPAIEQYKGVNYSLDRHHNKNKSEFLLEMSDFAVKNNQIIKCNYDLHDMITVYGKHLEKHNLDQV
jgi:hypothetical protein